MDRLKNPWMQFLIVAALGTGVGWAYKSHRVAEIAWSSKHYRLDETIGFPLTSGFPFAQQFILDAQGERIEVPLPEGQEMNLHTATWWSLEETGRMRIWNEDRVEVFPTLTIKVAHDSAEHGPLDQPAPASTSAIRKDQEQQHDS